MKIRGGRPDDAGSLAVLLSEYLEEALDAEWAGTPKQLARDMESGSARIIVAEQRDGGLVGFVGWVPAYDFHHCVRGGTIEDVFVHPQFRAAGLGVRLVLAAAAAIQENGGVYLRGLSVETPAVQKLYERVAVCRGTEECTVSGRAFRSLVDMKDKSMREIVGQLPNIAWNYQA